MPRHLHLAPAPDFDANLLVAALAGVGLSADALEAAERHARLPPGLEAADALAWAEAAPLSAGTRRRAVALAEAAAVLPAPARELRDAFRAVLAPELLDVASISCDPLVIPSGGSSMMPSPMTLELLRGKPVRGLEVDREPAGPLDVALALALADAFGPLPSVILEGTGSANADGRSLRLYLGRREEGGPRREQLIVLETNLDDLSAEILATLPETCLVAGALDAWLTPALMKKGRPGHCLHALCGDDAAQAVEHALYRHSSTLGVRWLGVERTALERSWSHVDTPWGTVRVKLGLLAGEVVNRAPEFEDCRRAAQTSGVALKEVYAAALASAER